MDFSLLRTCLAIYRTGSLTKAAQLLGVSQPAVTGQIRALEAGLEQQLFIRMPHGTVPTASAHALMRDTAEALDVLENALWRRLEPQELADRTVRLAGPAEILAARVLPEAAELLADGLQLEVSFGLTGELLAALAEGRYDLVVATHRPRTPGIEAVPLMDEEFLLVGAGEWARRLPAEIAARGADALRGVPLVAYAADLPIVRRYWITVFGEPPPASGAQVTVPDLRAVLAAVRSGAGVSVLPGYLCAEALERGELRLLHEVEVPPLNTLYLARQAGGRTSPGMARLHAHLLLKSRMWR